MMNSLMITNAKGAALIIDRTPDATGWNFSLLLADGTLLGTGVLSDIIAVMKTIAGHCGGKVDDGAEYESPNRVETRLFTSEYEDWTD